MIKQLIIYFVLIVAIIVGYRMLNQTSKTPVSALPLPLQSEGAWVEKLENLADTYEAKMNQASSGSVRISLANTLQFEYSSINPPVIVETAISGDYQQQSLELQRRGSVAQARIKKMLENAYGK